MLRWCFDPAHAALENENGLGWSFVGGAFRNLSPGTRLVCTRQFIGHQGVVIRTQDARVTAQFSLWGCQEWTYGVEQMEREGWGVVADAEAARLDIAECLTPTQLVRLGFTLPPEAQHRPVLRHRSIWHPPAPAFKENPRTNRRVAGSRMANDGGRSLATIRKYRE